MALASPATADTVTKGLEQTARDVGNGVVGLLNAFGSGKLKPDNIELLSDSKVALSFNGQRFNNPCGIEVFWGDGSSEKFRVEKDAYKTGFTLEHQYDTAQDYKIEINGKVIFRGLKTVVNCPGNFEGTIALANQAPTSSTQPPQDQATQTLSAESDETVANAEKLKALETEVVKKQAERIAELEAQDISELNQREEDNSSAVEVAQTLQPQQPQQTSNLVVRPAKNKKYGDITGSSIKAMSSFLTITYNPKDFQKDINKLEKAIAQIEETGGCLASSFTDEVGVDYDNREQLRDWVGFYTAYGSELRSIFNQEIPLSLQNEIEAKISEGERKIDVNSDLGKRMFSLRQTSRYLRDFQKLNKGNLDKTNDAFNKYLEFLLTRYEKQGVDMTQAETSLVECVIDVKRMEKEKQKKIEKVERRLKKAEKTYKKGRKIYKAKKKIDKYRKLFD